MLKKTGVSCAILLLLLVCQIHSKPKFEISKNKTKQGETLRVDIVSDQPITKAYVWFNSRNYPAYKKRFQKKAKTHYATFIGIPRESRVGEIQMSCVAFEKGKKYIEEKIITIEKAKFKRTDIELTGQKKSLAKKLKTLSKESKVFSNAFKNEYKRKFFTRPFIKPTEGRTSSPFGAYRTYNKRAGRKHSGIDIANNTGTEVVAANNGLVVLSRSFKIHGNSVVIDHDFGVHTVYLHLDKRLVKEGKWVRRGDTIGKMGKTGVSTGSHLHWGLSIHNTRVDPLFWLNNKLQ
jgi:murein DD-endopeptidase MepM/ murein hydrolase activator NlpD